MRLNLKTAPTTEPVSLEEAKRYLRVDTAEEDALLSGLIVVARESAERFLQRALITQTWEMVLDEAEAEIRIPLPPLKAVAKIETISEDGVKTDVSDALYYVEASQGRPGRVKLKSGCTWPTHRGFASFIITFQAGYGDNAGDVPGPVRQAIKGYVAHLYEHRGDEPEKELYFAESSAALPAAIQTLLCPYRVISF